MTTAALCHRSSRGEMTCLRAVEFRGRKIGTVVPANHENSSIGQKRRAMAGARLRHLGGGDGMIRSRIKDLERSECCAAFSHAPSNEHPILGNGGSRLYRSR